MAVLASGLRSELERAVGAGRGIAEHAALVVLTRLGVVEASAPAYLSEHERALRRGLRARARQLGDSVTGVVSSGLPLLVAEVAYEQWHRLLFARFLEANGLLIHPEFGASVTLEECGEFAAELGEPDAWSVAARFASEILPGIFRPDDPAARVRLAPEDLLALERVVAGLPEETFLAEDSLGWVYQFWQSKQKQVVNDSGRKIGGADISPVTQLFTEDYMVRFLLENSLGAWWAGKYPESPLLVDYDFLRFGDDGVPAAGIFEGWPHRVAEVTVMDPCCGSGHFLVAAFGMLWRMRAEEEGLSPAAAQDAVLRDNLFGLELDARCTQLAMFALALEAWKQGGYRALPVPNVACSGIPARAPLSEWTRLAKGDYKLEAGLTRLHELFKDADTLGSLIDPVRAAEQAGLESVDWHAVAPLLTAALKVETNRRDDPDAEVFGNAAMSIAHAAELLSGQYTLVMTNVPYLSSGKQTDKLRAFSVSAFPESKADLATTMLERAERLSCATFGAVTPDKLLYVDAQQKYRISLLSRCSWSMLALVGPRGFSTPMFDLGVILGIWSRGAPAPRHSVTGVGVEAEPDWETKAHQIKSAPLRSVLQVQQRGHPDSRFSFDNLMATGQLLSSSAFSVQGMKSGDNPRFVRFHWELDEASWGDKWFAQQSAPTATAPYAGRVSILRWDAGNGELARSTRARVQGQPAWQRRGVLIGEMNFTHATLYDGGLFDSTAVAVIIGGENLTPLWCYMESTEYRRALRAIDPKVGVATASFVKVPFDLERWRSVAAERYPQGLPEPYSADPTQWLHKGNPSTATEPLQVAVARLLGFRWPGQDADAIGALVDNDGIVCLPSVSGEQGAAERVRAALAASFDSEWSNARMDGLLVAAGGNPGDLEGWLRDVFFKHHTKVFQNRPLVWHVWDGRADGFSALVNYHRLNRQTLEKLTYTTLGWWIDRQRADARADVPGAGARLAAAESLQVKLALILEGEPPFDIYVRWKSLSEQPIGWDPDLDDGVRMNIRPFVEAKVLRSTFTINWRKDRGTNPDGSERHNDLHFTREQKEEAR